VVEIREVVSDADLTAWRGVFMVVVPNEFAPTIEQLRTTARRDLVRVLAEVDGEVVGSGVAGPSDFPGAGFVAPRVLPDARRRGYGTELLRRLLAHVSGLGRETVVAYTDDPGSYAFGTGHGFAEFDRQVEQIRGIGEEPEPVVPPGVEIVTVGSRPELWEAAYETVGKQAFEDMANIATIQVTPDQWEHDWIGDPDTMFLALADGEVIGCAGLLRDQDKPERAENALTAVRRDWRGRGVASALKRTTLAWAARNNITEVYTWTQLGNQDMRALNERLGYTYRMEVVNLRAQLPLTI
jgi:mycothiol synthase